MILPQTAAANDGLCAPCAKIPESLRRARREYEGKLSSGEWFTPSNEELRSAKQKVEITNRSEEWSPQPDFYKDSGTRSVNDVIDVATTQNEGHAFLVSDGGALLSLAFNEAFGVCEYQNEAKGEYFYAYSADNLANQVSADRHLVQACSCCGVGLLWYPSRFHMPRLSAFAIFSNAALGLEDVDAVQVTWMECGDIAYTARGRG